ncbi:hypothetical protein FPZ52_18470 (plasmid) [Qingshengfaniella alkalisoli]|uniref:Uncharacterized protein n=1 Tax=Qingshengfaniella alkalisoli TaxID=2599296 RepID=A0A5B8JCB1_9RHOB|nr:hypothetical protein FPZ52_18470 [Qingshengfaniella alkalisoli]
MVEETTSATTKRAATGGLPMVSATCPMGIEVHADEGGPVYINGNEAALQKFSDSYYEASGGTTTVSLSINPDRTMSVSYTGAGGANGVCTITS